MSAPPRWNGLQSHPFDFVGRRKRDHFHLDDNLTVPKVSLDRRADFCFSDGRYLRQREVREERTTDQPESA